MAVTLSYTGDVPITLEAGQSLWLQSAINPAAVVQAVWPGSGALTATLDTDTWGSAFTVLTRDPRGGPAVSMAEKAEWMAKQRSIGPPRPDRMPNPTYALHFFGNLRTTPNGPRFVKGR